jgi:hypothetical protein
MRYGSMFSFFKMLLLPAWFEYEYYNNPVQEGKKKGKLICLGFELKVTTTLRNANLL